MHFFLARITQMFFYMSDFLGTLTSGLLALRERDYSELEHLIIGLAEDILSVGIRSVK